MFLAGGEVIFSHIAVDIQARQAQDWYPRGEPWAIFYPAGDVYATQSNLLSRGVRVAGGGVRCCE
jgi:hypothetical protein